MNRIWLLTLIVAVLPAAFVSYQLWLYFDEGFPHLYFSRTLPALAAVAIGFTGLLIPLWVLMKRGAYRTWSRSRSWRTFATVLLLSVAGYLVPFLLLVDASRDAVAILPYTHSVYLLYDDSDVPNRPFRWGVVGGPGTGHGGTRSEGDRGVVTWTAPLVPRHVWGDRNPAPDVLLRSEFDEGSPTSRIDVEITTPLPLNFGSVGLHRPAATYDDQTVRLPIRLEPGTHRFRITTDPT